MGCSFCATGQMGFTRNLTAGEILEQVIRFNRWLHEHPYVPKLPGEQRPRYVGGPVRKGKPALPFRTPANARQDETEWFSNRPPMANQSQKITAVTNIVFMGMGEPLVNYNNLWG